MKHYDAIAKAIIVGVFITLVFVAMAYIGHFHLGIPGDLVWSVTWKSWLASCIIILPCVYFEELDHEN